MRWDVIIDAWLDPVAADSDVRSVLGNPPELWMVGERERAVPSCEWELISDIENENYEVTLVQLSFFVLKITDFVTLEQAVRRLCHHDTPIIRDGHELWSQLVGGGPLQGPDDGTIRRRLDFRLTYLRSRYA